MALESPKTKVSGKIVYQNPWITIHEDKTVTPEGHEGIYGYMETKDSVLIVALNEENKACMLKSFRYPTQTWGWEFSGGGGEGEAAVVAAQREFEEETGLLAEHWEVVGDTIVCNGLMTERQRTCLAYGIHPDGKKEHSDEVFAGMQFFSFDEIDEMIDSGEVNDNQTITAFYFAKRWLEKKDRQAA